MKIYCFYIKSDYYYSLNDGEGNLFKTENNTKFSNGLS